MESSDLALLTALDALLDESSVTRAARRLGLSTPATSHALARLRERLDDPLLVRAGRSMILTPRAEALKPRVRDALASAEQVFDDPGELDLSSLERTFAISLTDYVLMTIGETVESTLATEAPGVSLRLLLNAVDDADRLRRGDSDLAVGIYAKLPPEVRTRPLLTDRFVCVVREGHPQVKRRLTLNQYARLPHVQVAPRGRPGGLIDTLLEKRGLERRVARAVPFFGAALELAARSDYVLTVSERLAHARADELGLRVLEPPLPLPPYTLSMVWHPRFDADPAHRWLRETLLAAAATLT